MYSPIILLSLSSSLTLANTLSLPNSFPILPGLQNLTNPFIGNLLNATTSPEICSAQAGTDVKGTSCANAWEKISRSKEELTFRARQGVTTPDLPVPVRYLSDDGLCAIDIDLTPGVANHSTSGLVLSELAGALLVKCVYQEAKGGLAAVPGK